MIIIGIVGLVYFPNASSTKSRQIAYYRVLFTGNSTSRWEETLFESQHTHGHIMCVHHGGFSLSLLPWLCCDKWQLNQSSWLAGVSEIIALAPRQFQANSSCSSSLPSLLSCDSIRLDSPSLQLLAQPAGSSDPLLTPLFSAWTCATSNSYTGDMLCVPPCSSVAHIPLCFQLTEAFEGGCIWYM